MTVYRWRWWSVGLRGIAAVALGLISLFFPGLTFLGLVYVFGIYALVDGVLAVALAPDQHVWPRGWMIFRGLVSIAAGVIALVVPEITALVLLIVIAAWAIVAGITEIVMAIQLRKRIEHEWLLAIEGVLSVGFGIILFLAPLVGAIVIGLWIGAYALVLGGMLIASAFRLRTAAPPTATPVAA